MPQRRRWQTIILLNIPTLNQSRRRRSGARRAMKMKMLLWQHVNGLSMIHKVTEEEYAVISIREHKAILQALEQHNEALARQANA